MKLAALNKAGIERFEAFLDQAKGTTTPPPAEILTDNNYLDEVELLGGEVRLVDAPDNCTKKELVEVIAGRFSNRADLAAISQMKGVGAFLALHYFDTICKKKKNGTWLVRERAKYVPELFDHLKFYRHLILGPLSLFHMHGVNADMFLGNPASEHPDIIEQTASRVEVITSPSLIKVMAMLYWDTASGKVKETATSFDPVPDGALRRFVGPGSFTVQYGDVYDFADMTANQILGILPSEFDSWLS